MPLQVTAVEQVFCPIWLRSLSVLPLVVFAAQHQPWSLSCLDSPQEIPCLAHPAGRTGGSDHAFHNLSCRKSSLAVCALDYITGRKEANRSISVLALKRLFFCRGEWGTGWEVFLFTLCGSGAVFLSPSPLALFLFSFKDGDTGLVPGFRMADIGRNLPTCCSVVFSL